MDITASAVAVYATLALLARRFHLFLRCPASTPPRSHPGQTRPRALTELERRRLHAFQ
jgi:hypothetical protein